jgi:hypothetical protein
VRCEQCETTSIRCVLRGARFVISLHLALTKKRAPWHYQGTPSKVSLGVTGPCSPCPNASDPELQKGCVLYDLATDPGETTNLASRFPDVLAKLLDRLKELALESVEPMSWDPPFQGESYFCSGCPKHPPGTGVAVPWKPWCKDNGEDRSAPCVPVE